MSNDRFKLPAAVFLILIDQNSVLLLRRHNTGWHDGDFDLVAGHIDGHESLTVALAREVKEEMGITFDPADAQFAHLVHALFHEDGKEYFNVFFTLKKWQGQPQVMEPQKCSEFRWFELNKLPENLTPSARMGLNAFTTSTPYQEFGFDKN